MADRGYAIVYEINPFFYMLEVVRRPMLGDIPGIHYYYVAVGLAVLTFVAGVALQVKERREIVYKL